MKQKLNKWTPFGAFMAEWKRSCAHWGTDLVRPAGKRLLRMIHHMLRSACYCWLGFRRTLHTDPFGSSWRWYSHVYRGWHTERLFFFKLSFFLYFLEHWSDAASISFRKCDNENEKYNSQQISTGCSEEVDGKWTRRNKTSVEETESGASAAVIAGGKR